MVAIKTINGREPPIEPAKNGYKITKADLYSDSTGRSAETGVLLAYPVRLGVYTIELEYQGNDEQIKVMEELIAGTVLDVVFRDNGEYITRRMYPSDRNKDIETLKHKGRQILTFSLIEY